MIVRNGKFEGIALPLNIAPYSLYIIPKLDDENKTVIANNIYNELLKLQIPVLYDDRIEASIGAKIKDSKIVGTPYTVVFGRSLDEGMLEIENNKTGEKETVALEDFISYCKQLNEAKQKFN